MFLKQWSATKIKLGASKLAPNYFIRNNKVLKMRRDNLKPDTSTGNEYTEWMANVWRLNDERNKQINRKQMHRDGLDSILDEVEAERCK